VALDGADGHEQRLGDLPVRQAVGGELRDATLARGQRVTAAAGGAPRPRPAGDELVARGGRQAQRAAAIGEVERLAQRLTSVTAMPAAPQRGAERGERPSALVGRRPVDRGGRLAQQLDSCGAALDETRRSPVDGAEIQAPSIRVTAAEARESIRPDRPPMELEDLIPYYRGVFFTNMALKQRLEAQGWRGKKALREVTRYADITRGYEKAIKETVELKSS